MWVCITFVYLLPAVVITIQLLSPEISTLKVLVQEADFR
jgi:hypothetical protein